MTRRRPCSFTSISDVAVIAPSYQFIWEPWLERGRSAPDATAIVHLRFDEPAVTWSVGSLVAAAGDVAARLLEHGVSRGEVCATILRHHWAFYPIYLGITLVGAVPAVLAYPNPRLHPEKFQQGLDGMLAHSGFDWILTEEALLPALGPIADHAGRDYREILYPLAWVSLPNAYPDISVAPPSTGDPEAPCLLQHSSGTTGLQKPIMLSHTAVLEHLRRYGAAIDVRPDDVVVSWLPLYHDMGLIAAFHLSLACGLTLVQLDAFEWAQLPGILLRALHDYRGTLAWLPNFAYNLMADRATEEVMEGVRLEHVRMLVNCSERVREESHQRFIDRFRTYGLRDEVLGASYAMAEATFAVTQTRPGRRAPAIWLDRKALAAGDVTPQSPDAEHAVACTSSGTLISGCEVRVVDSEDRPAGPGAVGHLLVRSASLFTGYRNRPEKTREALDQGWYRTGDLGFCDAGEVYVVGRATDMIIVAGKNIYPDDIETAVSAVQGVIPGRSVAFGVDNARSGTEEVWVVAEMKATTESEQKSLRHDILRAVLQIDVTVARVVLVPPRWLVKSSSGKLSRHTNRERAIDEVGGV